MDSIVLEDIKKFLGISSDVYEFDIDIISAINSALFVLYQLGIGLSEPFSVDKSTTWDEIETTAPKQVIKDYIGMKVRMVFDPPSSSFVAEALRDRLSELEFRLNIHVDNGGGVVYG